MRIATTLCALYLATACGNKDEPRAGAAAQPITLEAINDAIPEVLRPKLRFEMIDGERNYFRVALPAGWKASFMPGTYEPPEGSPFGAMTRMRVSTNCDGSCEPKDWAATVAKIEFDRLAPDQIVRDEVGDHSRLAVARSTERVEIVAAWWKPGASRYFYCRATLSQALAPAEDAFLKACQSIQIRDW